MLRQLEQHITPGAAADTELAEQAAAIFHCTYDAENGGFGRAPKFPSAHNLLFLLEYGAREQDPVCLEMAEHTLLQMYLAVAAAERHLVQRNLSEQSTDPPHSPR